MEDTDSTQQEQQVLVATMELPGPVGKSAERGDLQAVEAWLEGPSSGIDAMDSYRWTLLHHACLANPITADSVAVAEYLLSRGASVNIGDSSVLHCAVARPSTSHATDMIGLLLRAGADVDARDDDSMSPIAWAMDEIMSNRSESDLTRALECVVQLLRHGASLADGHFGLKNNEHVHSEPRSLEDFLAFRTEFEGLTTNRHWIDCQAIVTGVKTAGSWRAFRDDKTNPWRAYERVPRKAVLRLRSLVARKRAKTTNPLFNALFASPNEIVWHVLGFWRVRIPSE
ncbi:unnamed protein product [Pelagomonas calceolata]|uniref:Uncharacterized protein n=1 Tax=Pelagomonas calceolata TaxID=35677 RepID=A0A8J2SL90_9STRA|nr:unnamed protein product [Pelagomonas calceolata]